MAMVYCYLLRSGDTDRYKIGHAENVHARKGGLQTGNPDPLTEILALRGGQPLEDFLHVVFKNRKVNPDMPDDEWFYFPEGELAAMNLVCSWSAEYRKIMKEDPDLKPGVLAEIAIRRANALSIPA